MTPGATGDSQHSLLFLGQGLVQLTPRSSHALSTSGVPILRYTFSSRNDPLNFLTSYLTPTSLRSGAAFTLAHARLPMPGSPGGSSTSTSGSYELRISHQVPTCA